DDADVAAQAVIAVGHRGHEPFVLADDELLVLVLGERGEDPGLGGARVREEIVHARVLQGLDEQHAAGAGDGLAHWRPSLSAQLFGAPRPAGAPAPRRPAARTLPRLALRQLGPRRLERLARDLVGGSGPGRRVRRLVAHEAAVALAVEQREDLLERHAALSGRQPVQRLARLEPGAGHVAVLEIRDLAERDVV